MSKETEFFHFYYWGLRRPLYRQSRQRLPFTLAVLANSFPRKTQAPQRTTLLSVGECVYDSRSMYMFSATGLPVGIYYCPKLGILSDVIQKSLNIPPAQGHYGQ